MIKAVAKVKYKTATELDDLSVMMINWSGKVVDDWLVKLCNMLSHKKNA